MSILVNPDCRDGKHGNCRALGWDLERDDAAPCPCECHTTEVDPNRLEIPLHPESVSAGPLGSGEEASRDGKRSSRPGRHLGSEHQPSSTARQTLVREVGESNG